MVILYLLETLKGLSLENDTQETIQAKIDEFSFSSLWFSGLGSALSLIVAQYTAFKIQHEHDLTLGQRLVRVSGFIHNHVLVITGSPSSCPAFSTPLP